MSLWMAAAVTLWFLPSLAAAWRRHPRPLGDWLVFNAVAGWIPPVWACLLYEALTGGEES